MDLSGGFFRQTMSNYQKVGEKLPEIRTVLFQVQFFTAFHKNQSTKLNFNQQKKPSFFHPSFHPTGKAAFYPVLPSALPMILAKANWAAASTSRNLPSTFMKNLAEGHPWGQIHGTKTLSGKICKIYMEIWKIRETMDQIWLNGPNCGKSWYPLVNIQKLWNITILNG